MKGGATNLPARATSALRAAAIFAALIALLGVVPVASAQVSQVTVRKTTRFVQTSPTDIAPAQAATFSFLASVDGTSISGISPPSVSGPFDVAGLGAQHNNGVMVYSPTLGGWRWGTDANEFRTTSRSELDRLFPNGIYSFNLPAGASVALSLSGDAYPNAPVFSLEGGSWSGASYLIDPAKPLTITTNAFSGYGTHANDVICLFLRGPGYSVPAGAQTSCPLYLQSSLSQPASNFVSVTIPANTFQASGEYTLIGSFNAIVEQRSTAALPGASLNARYLTVTTVSLKAVTPVFPMTVSSTITETSASATAAIQYRPQDVGTSGSIFTFAVAPSTVVKGGLEKSAVVVGRSPSFEKTDPPTCVLAQVNSTGQLVATTTSQLQAYVSGVLSASGASVTILNNASTAAVVGATFYVGYGTSATAMIQSGVYRNAVTVPGSAACPMFSSQTALWWNRTESGWGLNLNHQGNILFGTLFTYEASGAPMWLVMPAGALQSDGLTFTGELYRTTGPAFNSNPFLPIEASNITQVGRMTVSFVDVNTGVLRYSVNGAEVNKGIERQVFGRRAASCLPSTANRADATNYQDLWWVLAESGWGINVTHQDNTLFATLFTYDAAGKGVWLAMPAGQRQADGSYLGELYQTTGPAFNATPFTPIGAGNVTAVGTMRWRFSSGESGTVSYTYNGVAVSKNVVRQVFSSPLPACS